MVQLFPLILCQLLTLEAVTAAGLGIRSGSSEPASEQGWKLANICPDSLGLSRESCQLKESRQSGQISVANHAFPSLPDRPSPPTTLQYLLPLPLLVPSDVDECITGAHHCQQQCANTQGSYKCACEGGYVLSSSGLFCIGQLEQHALHMYSNTLHSTVYYLGCGTWNVHSTCVQHLWRNGKACPDILCPSCPPPIHQTTDQICSNNGTDPVQNQLLSDESSNHVPSWSSIKCQSCKQSL